MKKSSIAGCLIVCASLALGCGGSDLPKPVSVTPAAPPALKSMIDNVVTSGELGSGADAIKTELDNLSKTDEAKAKGLKADLEKMQKMSDPEAIKKLAKQMSDKL